MDIRPIGTDEDHTAALREIESAVTGTEDDDKLDILATLVEKYEEKRWPSIDASDPIRSICSTTRSKNWDIRKPNLPTCSARGRALLNC
jgi:antitoxin component HigA of HigAB toxin-antitoxin module